MCGCGWVEGISCTIHCPLLLFADVVVVVVVVANGGVGGGGGCWC